MGETETKINQCGNKQAGSHKTIYITSICQKSIRKFTHRIRKEQHRTDYSEFRFRKDSLVYNRFLYYIQAQPAYIPYPKVAERKVDHCRYFNRRLPDEDITSPLQGPGEETL